MEWLPQGFSQYSKIYCRYSQFSKTVLEMVRPDIVFAAHHHTGFDRTYSRETGKDLSQTIHFKKADLVPVTTNLTHDREIGAIHEINVPTCSYRMGVPEMAFGLARFDFSADGTMTYHNLWLPSRFAMLFLYLAAAILCTMLYSIGSFRSMRRARMSAKRRISGSGGGVHYSKLI
jgi:hypothetical protein